MYLRFKLFKLRFVFYIRRVTTVNGVNSNLKDGNHIPMLDFDGATLKETRMEVYRLQKQYKLGKASICSTGRPKSYHVYFWNVCTWQQAVQIVASSRLGDLKHLQFSLRRGHFTLRISDKKSRKIECIEEINYNNYQTCSHEDLISFVTYETGSKVNL